ncbi:MAG: hypothetical protein LBU25_03725 [Treponema sp.]|jgi:3-methyladenine DNA glycosylase AlkD|nr:hypothetical protein [Treponema sp.]
MSVEKYAEKVVRSFVCDITDHVFCNIQYNEDLMREYQSQVNTFGLDAVNMAIGKKVKELFKLQNDGENNSPKSFLIKSYTYHSL